MEEQQQLYRRLADEVWSPQRLAREALLDIG